MPTLRRPFWEHKEGWHWRVGDIVSWWQGNLPLRRLLLPPSAVRTITQQTPRPTVPSKSGHSHISSPTCSSRMLSLPHRDSISPGLEVCGSSPAVDSVSKLQRKWCWVSPRLGGPVSEWPLCAGHSPLLTGVPRWPCCTAPAGIHKAQGVGPASEALTTLNEHH